MKKIIVKKLVTVACVAGMVMGLTGCHLSIWGYAVDRAAENIQEDSEESSEYSYGDAFSTEDQTTEEQISTEDITEKEATHQSDSEESTESGNVGRSLTNSTLDPDIQTVLDSLSSDYNKVLWGSVYSVIEQYAGIVVSVTPCLTGDDYGLLVAVTNLYNEPMAFSGKAQAKGTGEEIIGETYFSEDCIGTGNTVIKIIDCGDTYPDGRIHWEDCMAEAADGVNATWSGDYAVTGDPANGSITINYNIHIADGSAAKLDEAVIVLLDENGMAITAITAYPDDIPAGGSTEDSTVVYADPDILKLAKSIAVFVNPILE